MSKNFEDKGINRQLFSAFENAAIGMALTDYSGRWIFVNSSLCRMLGYTREELQGKTFQEITHPDDLPSDQNALKNMMARKIERYSTEKRYIHKNGYTVWAELNVSLLEGHENVEACWFAQVQDISKRKSDEMSLLESHELLNTLLEAMPQIAWMTDDEKNTNYFNEQWTIYTGNERANKKWENLIYFFHPDEHETITDIWKQAKVTGKEYSFEARLRKLDKSYEWWLLRGIPIKDRKGIVTKWVVTCTNIDEIKKTIEYKKAREEMILAQANLINQIRDAVISMSLMGQILIWNEGAERLYGWTAEEAVGRFDTDLYADDSEERREGIRQLREKGFWEGEFSLKNRQGATISVESRMTLVRDLNDQEISITIISVDVTEWKKKQASVLRSQRLESLGTLSGGIAHDLNNVLTPIMMASKFLSSGETDQQRIEIYDTIFSCTQRGAEMISQVLAFSRGVEGERNDLLINNKLTEVYRIVENTFLKNIEIKLLNFPELWSIKGDATQIHQVLLNLCVNARDAMPGGGRLTMYAQNVILDESLAAQQGEAPGTYVRVTVEDTGTGIDGETLARVFEPYFTTKEFGKGTGLGLSTSLAIVKSHGGFVRVASEIGVGTKFHVYFPTCEKNAIQNDLSESWILIPGSGECILVIDNDLAVRNATCFSLEKFGYRVQTVEGGAEAIKVYSVLMERIHLILIDSEMLDINTVEAFKEINPLVRIVFTSALPQNWQKSENVEFLEKPYKTENLLSCLHRVLNKNTGKTESAS